MSERITLCMNVLEVQRRHWKRVSVTVTAWGFVVMEKSHSLRLRGKVYKTVVKRAMVYGAETWAVNKVWEKKLDVLEMRMLRRAVLQRWTCRTRN